MANAKQLAALEQYKWLILALGLDAGPPRYQDGSPLSWKQVEVDGRGVMFRDIDGRDVPVNRESADALAEARTEVDNEDEYPPSPSRKPCYTVASSCVVASQRKGIKISLPQLRDTRVVNRIAEGVSERWVRQAAGFGDERGWWALVPDWRPKVDVRAVRGMQHESPKLGLRAAR